jgi:hypothetical protein
MHTYCTTQMTFIFGCFLGQNVTFESLAPFDGATWTNTKTLFSAALGLHFGHSNAPSLQKLMRCGANFAPLVDPESIVDSNDQIAANQWETPQGF